MDTPPIEMWCLCPFPLTLGELVTTLTDRDDGRDAMWFLRKEKALFTITLVLGPWTLWLAGGYPTVRKHEPPGEATCRLCKRQTYSLSYLSAGSRCEAKGTPTWFQPPSCEPWLAFESSHMRSQTSWIREELCPVQIPDPQDLVVWCH